MTDTRLTAVRALHRDAYASSRDTGRSCTAGCGTWPCPTIRALDAEETAAPVIEDDPAPADRDAVLREAAEQVRQPLTPEESRLAQRTWGHVPLQELLARRIDPQATEAPGETHDETRCTCGGRFPVNHLHADAHQPATEAPGGDR